MKIFIQSIFFVILMLLTGCAVKRPVTGIKISNVRPAPSNTKAVELAVARKELTAALNQEPDVNRIRIIRLLSSMSLPDTVPEHRLFDVKPKSVYELLGLKNSDVLVAADDYLIYDPNKFKAFVSALAGEKEASIEIRRNGMPMLLRYTFVD